MFKKYLLLGFSIILVFSSCSSIYMPNVPNTPMLASKGEFHGGGHLSLKGNLSLNSAYAISDHIGIMANGSIISSERKKKDFKQNLLEGAIGYFDTFGPNNDRIFEVYGGYGIGNTDKTYKSATYSGPVINEFQEVSYNKTFVQLNYSSKKKKDLKLFGDSFPLNYGTALRISYVNMSDFTLTKYNTVDMTKVVSNPLMEDNIFIEPVFFTRMYLTDVIQIQYTTGSNFGLINRKYLTAGNSVFSLGLIVNLREKVLKK
jgi:hypothetical protein